MLEEYFEAGETIQIGLNYDLNHPELLQDMERVKLLLSKHGQLSWRGAMSVGTDEKGGRTAKRHCAGTGHQRLASVASVVDSGRTIGEPVTDDEQELLEADFQCPLCCKLLFEPVTTPCGHSFCRGCLVRSLDHANRCPMCRTVLHVSSQKHPISVSLQNMLTQHFWSETNERQAEKIESVNHGPCVLPLFVVDFVLPGQTIALNCFEPRYLLMVRRCLDGDRRFGVLSNTAPTHDKELGCEVEIHDSRQLHDGRYHIQVKVLRRFWVIRKWDLDGYRVARVTFFCDEQATAAAAVKRDAPQRHDATAERGSQNLLALSELAVKQDATQHGGLGACSGSAACDLASEGAVSRGVMRLKQLVRQLQIMVKEWLVRTCTLCVSFTIAHFFRVIYVHSFASGSLQTAF